MVTIQPQSWLINSEEAKSIVKITKISKIGVHKKKAKPGAQNVKPQQKQTIS